MAIANLRWSVSQALIDILIADGFDSWIIEREGVSPLWNEISYPTTRTPIISTVLTYLYTDPSASVDVAGEIDDDYRAVPYRSSDDVISTPIDITATRRGYITPADVWAEGYANPPWTPAKVWRGIDRATSKIDNLCRQWFEPRYAQFAYDGVGHDQLWLDIPIIALFGASQDDTVVDLTDLEVYNRHLTRGQLSPDDRQNPKITYSRDYPPGYRDRQRRVVADAAWFTPRRKNIILKGIFGYTELGPGDYAAETSEDSQVPISYGQTPEDIKHAALVLTLIYMMPMADQQDAVLNGRLTSVTTRDQSFSLAAPSASDASYGLTGNIEVDDILSRYMGPIRMGAIG